MLDQSYFANNDITSYCLSETINFVNSLVEQKQNLEIIFGVHALAGFPLNKIKLVKDKVIRHLLKHIIKTY